MDDALEPQAKRVRVQEPPDESSSMTAAVPTEIEISTALKPVDPPKRDREHASMMVSGLPPSAGESDLRKLFEDVCLS